MMFHYFAQVLQFVKVIANLSAERLSVFHLHKNEVVLSFLWMNRIEAVALISLRLFFNALPAIFTSVLLSVYIDDDIIQLYSPGRPFSSFSAQQNNCCGTRPS